VNFICSNRLIIPFKSNTFEKKKRMKKTALYQRHIQADAKMVPFAGFEMPVQYAGVKQEHLTVRSALGVFDVSHMGEFKVKGPNATALLQHICSNDIEKLQVGKAQYNYLPNGSGGVVDDLIVYKIDADHYMLVVNASNIDKDWVWITQQNASFQAELENCSDQLSLLAIQGPKALEAMQKLTQVALDTLPFYAHQTGTFAGVEDVLIATTGYTGSGGIEIYFPNAQAEKIWDAVLAAGADLGIAPIGLAARDTLRLEMGYCLYGNEIDEHTSPIAAGLGWVTKPEVLGIDQALLSQQKKAGTPQRLVAFELIDRGIPRGGYTLVDAAQNPIGVVTSGTQSPSLDKGIGLGYVTTEQDTVGTEIGVMIRDKYVAATVVRLPFCKA
jgi:aminomethyltransferase